ncbi:MAG: sugar phosphate nucleotidyltransferase [Saprospiraceae bacterium]
MKTKPTLLVLAAGMGSRYGKLKQLDGFGPNGETIIDYSLYDAVKAGFGKVVFIVRDFFREEFEAIFRAKLGDRVEMIFVSQEIDKVPAGSTYDLGRSKPWGTGHAVWVAKDVINEPFGVINADDYYGVDSFRQLHDFLQASSLKASPAYSVIAYYLKNTLSAYGTVNRGVCLVSDEHHLIDIKECTKIKRDHDNIIRYPVGDSCQELPEGTLVSMNMWGFMPDYFTHCERIFIDFLSKEGMNLSSEFYIPNVVDQLINEKLLNVEVLETESDWFGVTYQEDKPFVMDKIKELIDNKVYPSDLWK